jgi:hypothetical protein
MPFFNTVKDEILADYFGDSATKMGTPIEIGLSTTEPNGDGTGITEPGGGSYARVSVANTDAEWSLSVAGDSVENVNELQFPQATAGWGIIGWFVLYQSGTPKFFGPITNAAGNSTTKNVLTGDYFWFIENELKIQFPPVE